MRIGPPTATSPDISGTASSNPLSLSTSSSASKAKKRVSQTGNIPSSSCDTTTTTPSCTPTPKRLQVQTTFRKKKRKSATATAAVFPPSKSRQKLVLQPAKGDGNCLFRSFSIHIYGDESWHDRVREDCVNFMRKDAAHFECYVSGSFQEYVDGKSRFGVFGDHVEIQAMAELYNRPVVVFSTDVDTEEGESEEDEDAETTAEYIHMDHHLQRVKRLNIFQSSYTEGRILVPIMLCYRGRSHYDAVIDVHQPPAIGVGLGLDANLPHNHTADLEATQLELEKTVMAASLEVIPKNGMETNESLSAHVKELVFNGFPLERVLWAHHLVGDSLEDMLELLLHQS